MDATKSHYQFMPPRPKINVAQAATKITVINLFLCIMLRYLCVKFQRLTSFGWQDILIYIKVGDPRTKKLIVLGILTQSKKGRVRFFVL